MNTRTATALFAIVIGACAALAVVSKAGGSAMTAGHGEGPCPGFRVSAQEIPALNAMVREIDREIREVEVKIRDLDGRIGKLDQDIAADEAVIRKLESLIARAATAKNAEAEAVARGNLAKTGAAKTKNEAMRAALADERKGLAAALGRARARESAWKGETRMLIAERLRRDMDPLTRSVMESLDDPSKRLRPVAKPFADLQPGDVLLVAPDKAWNLVRLGDRLSSWEWGSQASHTLICLKTVNGTKLFLDDMPHEGPLIKTESQVLNEYGGLAMDVAQPLKKPDGDRMWEAAKTLVRGNLDRKGRGLVDETGYGFVGDDNMVCSEASRWALVQAGVPVPETDSPFKMSLGIFFGPSNFYADRQHFLIAVVEAPAGK
jgi:peptidoglycan hydrolase CwlO-like protein